MLAVGRWPLAVGHALLILSGLTVLVFIIHYLIRHIPIPIYFHLNQRVCTDSLVGNSASGLVDVTTVAIVVNGIIDNNNVIWKMLVASSQDLR